MKRFTSAAVAAAMVWSLTSSAGAMGHDLISNDRFQLNMGGRAQLIGYGENVADPVRDNNRIFLFLKQARLNVHGHVDEYKYNTEWAFAAEDINGSNTSLTLLDFNFDIPMPGVKDAWIRAGQFKVPYSRERIAYSGNLQFAERSLMNQGFGMGRDVGIAVHGQREKMNGVVAVVTGGGRDVPQRFLPEVLGFPMVVLRAGYNDGVDADAFTAAQNDLDIQSVQKSVHVNALYMKDHLIGHNSAFGVKTTEKSIMLNSSWNPFIGRSPLQRGDLWQAGWDAVYRRPMGGSKSLNAEVEMNHSEFSNRYGTVMLNGARAQAGVLFNKKVEVALRYSALFPDDAFRDADRNGASIMGKTIVSEIVPAATWYVKGHDLKLVFDVPVLLNAPVTLERGLGSYVLTEQPDQTGSTSAAGVKTPFAISRQTVTQARLMLQVAF